MDKIIFSPKHISQINGGIKAKKDIEKILQNAGFHIFKISKKICALDKVSVLTMHEKVIVLQYPFGYYLPLLHLKHLCRRNKVIIIVHDIPGMQYGTSISRSLKILNEASFLIVHNMRFKTFLVKNKINYPQIFILNMFDYLLYDKKILNHTDDIRTVCFCGSFLNGKSKFVFDWIRREHPYHIELYGNVESSSELLSSPFYKGVFNPDKINEELHSAFGLVWDGDSIDLIQGHFGLYQQYNNPHKLSGYIVAGIPVFVWSGSAVSTYVKEKGIGFCIDSLSEIDSIIKNISLIDYKALYCNVIKERNKLVNGYYTRNVLKQIGSTIL